MTISNITVGTAATGNNASVTPGTPSGLAAGDLVIILAAIRNTAGAPATPAGWTAVAANTTANVRMFGRFWQTGDTIPLITFAGGVANADTYARALKCRGAALDTLVETTAAAQDNVSAANIAYPAFDTPGSDMLLLLAAWKQDDATTYSTPSGWTAQGMTSQTTGDDMSVALYTLLQTTEADITSGSITVTGGASAISAALIWAVRSAPVIAVTELDLFPPRVLVSVTGLTLGDDVTIYRVVGGERTAVRDGDLTSATDPSFVVTDGQLPFGVPVSYVAVVNSVAEYSTAPATYTLAGGKPALSDAITGEASEFVIVAWDEKSYEPQASVFKVGGRNVVVMGELGQYEGTMEIFFEAYSSSEQFRTLIATATEGVLQLRTPNADYLGVDSYLSVITARERRFSQDGTDERRTWVLQVVETEEWSEGLAASAFTYQDVADFYSSTGTYADWAGDYATHLGAALGDYTP
jgi:hypothetical protein